MGTSVVPGAKFIIISMAAWWYQDKTASVEQGTNASGSPSCFVGS